MSSSKNSNENNTQNSASSHLPTWGAYPFPTLLTMMLGSCWVQMWTSVPRTEPSLLRHLTTTPWGAIGCDPVSQSRAWDLKRKEDYQACLSNKQELLTARPHSLQLVKSRLKKQRLCPFTIYLQIPTWEQLARNHAHSSHSTCAASPAEALLDSLWSQLWEQAESCKPCSKVYPPLLQRAAELALWYQLQATRSRATLSPRLRRGGGPFCIARFSWSISFLSGHIFTAPPINTTVKFRSGKCFKLANYLSPQTFRI